MDAVVAGAEKARDRLESHIDDRLKAMAEIRDLKLRHLTDLLTELKPMVQAAVTGCKGRTAAIQAQLDKRFKQIDDAILRLQVVETDLKTLQDDVDGLYGDPPGEVPRFPADFVGEDYGS